MMATQVIHSFSCTGLNHLLKTLTVFMLGILRSLVVKHTIDITDNTINLRSDDTNV